MISHASVYFFYMLYSFLLRHEIMGVYDPIRMYCLQSRRFQVDLCHNLDVLVIVQCLQNFGGTPFVKLPSLYLFVVLVDCHCNLMVGVYPYIRLGKYGLNIVSLSFSYRESVQ